MSYYYNYYRQLGNKENLRESIIEELKAIDRGFDDLITYQVPKGFIVEWKKRMKETQKALIENKIDYALEIVIYVKSSFNKDNWTIPHPMLEKLINIKTLKLNKIIDEIELLKLKNFKKESYENEI